MNKLFRFPIAGAIAAMALVLGMAWAEQEEESLPSFYRPDEEEAYFDLIMKPYPIPVATTTYVDFSFNLPDNLPEFFHVVYGEVINSQPQHLHHLHITGCYGKLDPSKNGMVRNFDEIADRDCFGIIGGWAPGREVFGKPDMDTGVLLGRGMGITSVTFTVHYTDGAYEDAAMETLKMATDGIRVYYTPVLRPYTKIFKTLVNLGSSIEELSVPPGESRFYVTRSCKVENNCQDTNTDTITSIANALGLPSMILGDISCASFSFFCNIGGQVTTYLHDFCPSTCGLCDNLAVPESYRLTSVYYHAHLMGREMYTTLIREEPPSTTDTPQPPNTMVKDLKSQEFWIFDFQQFYDYDYDDFVVDTTNAAELADVTDTEILRGTEVKVGDKLQLTCVYDSTDRTKSTRFSTSTYDEMCFIVTVITFKTPESLLKMGDTDDIDTDDTHETIRNELRSMSFKCVEDKESDVYTGILAEDEDGRDIWKNHPIIDAEGCTFPVIDAVPMLFQTRNCDSITGDSITSDFDIDILKGDITIDDSSSSNESADGIKSESDSKTDSDSIESPSAAGPCFTESGIRIGMVLSAFAFIFQVIIGMVLSAFAFLFQV